MDANIKRLFGVFVGLVLVNVVFSGPPIPANSNYQQAGTNLPQNNAPSSEYKAPGSTLPGGYIQTAIPGLRLLPAENIFKPKNPKFLGNGGQLSFFFSPKDKVLYQVTAIPLESTQGSASAYGAPSVTGSNYGAPSQSAPALSYGAPSGQAPAPAYGVPISTYGAPAQSNSYQAPAPRKQYGDNQNRRPRNRSRPRPKYNITFAIETYDDDCEEDNDQPEDFGENRNPHLTPQPISGYRKKRAYRGSQGSRCNDAGSQQSGENPLRPLSGGYQAPAQPSGGYSNQAPAAPANAYRAPKSQYGAPATVATPSSAYGAPSVPSGYYDELEVAGPANAAPGARPGGRGGRRGYGIRGSASGEI